MNLLMNLRDLELFVWNKLKMFAVPPEMVTDSTTPVIAGIKEPFKKITVTQTIDKGGEKVQQKVLVGIRYRFDGDVFFLDKDMLRGGFEEDSRWSPASQMPESVIRHHTVIERICEAKPIRSITEAELRLLHLDYASQKDPQTIIEDYLPTKNYEILYSWWKAHYKATLKDCDNPMVTLLYL